MEENVYTLKVGLEFSGTVKVCAESQIEALRIVFEGFSLSCGEVQTSDTRIVDWDIDMTPEKKIELCKQTK